ncbi:endonuclease III domain-containing protein, partial [Faecalibaculum rodentium]
MNEDNRQTAALPGADADQATPDSDSLVQTPSKSTRYGDEIIHEIEKIFPDAECELHHESPFQLLVAVALSAQTTDAAVNKVTPALFAAYPNADAMSRAEPADLEPY